MISLEELEQMFAAMKDSPEIDIKGNLLWGYYFADPDSDKLDKLEEELITLGYQPDGLYQDDDEDIFVLHVEKTEHHTPQTLFVRNNELLALAKKFGVAEYDGMDAGPILDAPHA